MNLMTDVFILEPKIEHCFTKLFSSKNSIFFPNKMEISTSDQALTAYALLNVTEQWANEISFTVSAGAEWL